MPTERFLSVVVISSFQSATFMSQEILWKMTFLCYGKVSLPKRILIKLQRMLQNLDAWFAFLEQFISEVQSNYFEQILVKLEALHEVSQD